MLKFVRDVSAGEFLSLRWFPWRTTWTIVMLTSSARSSQSHSIWRQTKSASISPKPSTWTIIQSFSTRVTSSTTTTTSTSLAASAKKILKKIKNCTQSMSSRCTAPQNKSGSYPGSKMPSTKTTTPMMKRIMTVSMTKKTMKKQI